MEFLLIVLFWIVFIGAMTHWLYDYGKSVGFKFLKHDKKHGKAVL